MIVQFMQEFFYLDGWRGKAIENSQIDKVPFGRNENPLITFRIKTDKS